MPEPRGTVVAGRVLLTVAVTCGASALVALVTSDHGSHTGTTWVLATLCIGAFLSAFVVYDADDKRRASGGA